MKAIGIHRKNKHSLTLSFDEGEKCFCCSKIFKKETDVVHKFKTQNEYEEYVSSLKFYWNIELNSK